MALPFPFFSGRVGVKLQIYLQQELVLQCQMESVWRMPIVTRTNVAVQNLLNILTLRKSRFTVAASKLHSMWNANLLDTVEN